MLSRALSSWGRALGLGRGRADMEEDRRLWARFACSIETTCQPTDDPDGERLRARVQDISRGGVNLLLDRAFEAGSLLSLELPCSAEDEGTATVLACVVHVEARTGGEWALGCHFACGLSDDDLRLFGARRARPEPPDKRIWQRFDCQAHVRYQPVNAPDVPHCPARVLNISASGVGLAVTAPLRVGELLSIELRGGDDQVVRTTLASVVRVLVPAPGTSEHEGERIVGCNFIHDLGEEELKSLV